jgi:hypothetical protein
LTEGVMGMTSSVLIAVVSIVTVVNL